MHLFAVRETVNDGLGGRNNAGALVIRKWLVAPELRMAHCLMVLALVLIVFNRTEAAKA
jgi:hypothetical protein